MAKYYVYTLSYPPEMGGAVFYVGKGKAGRIKFHEAQARKGERGERYDVIRAIWQAGHQVVGQVIHESDDEGECMAIEALRIEELSGDVLTNHTHNFYHGKRTTATGRMGFSLMLTEATREQIRDLMRMFGDAGYDMSHADVVAQAVYLLHKTMSERALMDAQEQKENGR